MSRAIPKWEPIEGDLASPLGFRAAAVAAGIKKTRDALDLALIFSIPRRRRPPGYSPPIGLRRHPFCFHGKIWSKAGDVAAPSSSIPEMPMPAPDVEGMHTARKPPASPQSYWESNPPKFWWHQRESLASRSTPTLFFSNFPIGRKSSARRTPGSRPRHHDH